MNLVAPFSSVKSSSIQMMFATSGKDGQGAGTYPGRSEGTFGWLSVRDVAVILDKRNIGSSRCAMRARATGAHEMREFDSFVEQTRKPVDCWARPPISDYGDARDRSGSGDLDQPRAHRLHLLGGQHVGKHRGTHRVPARRKADASSVASVTVAMLPPWCCMPGSRDH